MGMFSYYKKSYQKAASRNRKYLSNKLTKKGATKANSALDNLVGRARELDGVSKAGIAFWGGGIALGVPRRLREGESLPGAIGREAIRDAAYIAVPHLLPLQLAKGVAGMYPDLNQMAEAERSTNLNFRTLGGGYQDSEADHASRARAMEMIQRTKQPQPGGEARRYHRTP